MKFDKVMFAITIVSICTMFMATVATDVEAAKDIRFGDTAISYGGFSDMDSGYVDVYVTNEDTANDYVVKVQAEDLKEHEDDPPDVRSSETATIPAGETVMITLRFGYDSSGLKYVNIALYEVESGEGEESTETLLDTYGPLEINVSHSIWKDWVTYVIVVVIIIAAVVVAYFYFRGAPERAARAEKKTMENKSSKAEKKSEGSGIIRKSKR